MPDPPAGTGSLGGNIFETDTIISPAKSTFEILKKPAKEDSVVLVNRRKATGGDVIATVYTDHNGDFIISGVADGDYTLIADIPGLPHESYYDITITGGEFVGNLDYEVGLEEIYTVQTTRTDDYMDHSSVIHLYPNPCFDEFRISISDNSGVGGILKVEIFTVTGQLSQSICIENPKSVNTISTGSLKPGIYLVRIGLSGENHFERLIKL